MLIRRGHSAPSAEDTLRVGGIEFDQKSLVVKRDEQELILSPIGYKIALEIFVKGDFEHPSEVPIHFSDRQYGESKLSLKEQLNFLRHLLRLYAYKLRAGPAS